MSMLKPIDVKLNSDLTKNRINVVFLFDKNFETLRTKVASILTDDLSDYSLFNMEPYKSNKNAFNFWYMDTVVDELKYSVENFLATNNVKFISTVNLKEATINQDEKFTTENGRANADRSIVEYSKDYSTINSYKPGNVRMFYSDKLDFELARVLNHEFGHSILKLNDEYSEPETKLPIYGFPNCAETEAQAKEWWGDLIGTIDPEFYVVREKRIASIIEGEKLNPPEFRTFELIDNKLTRINYIQDPNNSTKSIRVDNTIVDLNEILNEEDYRVTLTNREGCFAESGIKLSYKPTSKSMMDSYGISYGNVNIREGNKILNLFKTDTPPKSPFVPKYFNEVNIDALSNADCKVIKIDNKHTFNCKFINQLTSLSNLNKIGYQLIKQEGKYPDIKYREPILNPCKIEENNTVINCTGIIIDNIDINANYSIGLIIDSSELYKDQNLTEKELEFTKSGSSVMIKDRSRLDLENLYFKITEYISADELKPIIVPDNNPVVVPETKPVVVSTTPNNVVAKANIVSPIATVRTGGNNLINLQLSFILVLSVLINYKVKKIIN